MKPETLDVINAKDEVIKQASREDCHNDASLIHRAVHFTLIDPSTRKIMISRRSLLKKYDGGKMCFLGEHVLSGETYSDAVCRGAEEELGIKAVNIHEVGEHIFSESTFTERIKMFLIEFDSDSQLKTDPDEIEGLAWQTPEQLVTVMASEMTQYWISHLDWTNVFELE